MPTYATWNPSDCNANVVLSGGNLIATCGSVGAWGSCRATVGVSTGKWYWECTVGSTGSPSGNNSPMMGLMNSGASTGTYAGGSADSAGIQIGNTFNGLLDGVTADYTGSISLATSDVWSFAFDAGAGKLWVARNGTYFNAAPTGADVWSGMSANGPWFPSISYNASLNTPTLTANFGASAFSFSVPAGFNSGLYTGATFSPAWALNKNFSADGVAT